MLPDQLATDAGARGWLSPRAVTVGAAIGYLAWQMRQSNPRTDGRLRPS